MQRVRYINPRFGEVEIRPDTQGPFIFESISGIHAADTALRVTYPGDGYGQPPRVTIRPNGFGRIVNSPNGVGSGMSADGVTPMNRVHIRALGGTLVAVAGAGVGDPGELHAHL